MKMRYVAAALLAFLATPAQAVTVNVFDVGASGTTQLQGYVDVNGTAVSIPNLTGTLGLEYTGVSNGGLTWNFDYLVTNTSSLLITNSRVSSFGLNTTPNIVSGVSTGLFDNVLLNPQFPNVNGANAIEMCFAPEANGCSGGTGLLSGQFADGTFSLTFGSVLGAINLDAAYLRFQSIDGSSYNFNGASGVGFNVGDVVINPLAVPGPMVGAGIPGVVGACVALFGLIRLRRRRHATA